MLRVISEIVPPSWVSVEVRDEKGHVLMDLSAELDQGTWYIASSINDRLPIGATKQFRPTGDSAEKCLLYLTETCLDIAGRLEKRE